MNTTARTVTQTNIFGQNLRLKQAADYLNISTTTLWRLGESDPTFPSKIHITSRCCVYRKADIDAYLEAKKGA
jgi:predicted DNA-binding transcriptional regulator AlpA